MWQVPQSFCLHNVCVYHDIPPELKSISKTVLKRLLLKYHPDKGGNVLQFRYLDCLRKHTDNSSLYVDSSAIIAAKRAKQDADEEEQKADEEKRKADEEKQKADRQTTRYQTLNTEQQKTGRPRGRPPKNKIWNQYLKMYISP